MLVRHILVVIFILFVVMFQNEINAGPSAYAICQAGCNAAWMACVAVVGGTAGVCGLGCTVVILLCNAQEGACMTACIAADVGPII